jgi:hypothetical protein
MRRFALAALVAVTALVVTSAAAARVLVNEQFTFDALIETCNLELVAGQWTQHNLVEQTVDANGGVHTVALVTTQFTGQDASGHTYVSPSHQTFVSIGDPDNPTIFSESFTWNVIRTGEGTSADDLQMRAVFHFTFDANGRLTNFKFEFFDECS